MNKRNTHPLKYKSYFSYIKAKTKNNGLYQNAKNVYTFFQNYILIGRILRYIKIFIIWIETGAYFLMFVSLLVIIMPILILLCLSFYLHTVFLNQKNNKKFLKLISDYDFCIFFINSEEEILTECDSKNVIIYVYTNPFSKLTASSRQLKNNTFIINVSYFYSLKKHVLDKNKNKVIYK